MPRGKKPAEEKQSAPTWIVSFSDMVTLLLAFFVLLQSFAHVQDPELFFVGQGSFKRAIAGLGIPSWLFGRKDKTRRDHVKIKHASDETPPEHPKPRIIDADNEKIRDMFADLQKELTTTATDLSQEVIRVEATPVRFRGADTALDDPARRYLRQFAFDVGQTVRAGAVRVYVVGLAADVPQVARQWTLSARRARAVETCLSGLLRDAAGATEWSVSSWGAGAGGSWCRRHGFLPDRTAIVIALVKEKGGNG